MEKRLLRNLEVSAIGYGVMGFSHGYGVLPPKEDAIQMIRMSYDLGCTFFDTAPGLTRSCWARRWLPYGNM